MLWASFLLLRFSLLAKENEVADRRNLSKKINNRPDEQRELQSQHHNKNSQSFGYIKDQLFNC